MEKDEDEAPQNLFLNPFGCGEDSQQHNRAAALLRALESRSGLNIKRIDVLFWRAIDKNPKFLPLLSRDMWMLMNREKGFQLCASGSMATRTMFLLLWPCPNIPQDGRNAVVSRKRFPVVLVGCLFPRKLLRGRREPLHIYEHYIRLYHSRSPEFRIEDDHFESIAFYR